MKSQALLLAAVMAFVYIGDSAVDAFNLNNPNHQNPARREAFTKQFYRPDSSPISQTPPMTAQRILNTPGVKSNTLSTEKDGNPEARMCGSCPLSESVLASCDTLPRFPTAHGLLSPETVMRMDRMTHGKARNDAVALFLDTYARDGPMSCLPMLSDPNVLPHLTEAMREMA